MDLNSINFSYWILQTVAMLLTCLLIPGLTVSGPISALLTVIVMSFVNAHLWNAALFFSIPNTLTLQVVCLFIANGLIFWTVVKLLPGIAVRGILPALVAPVIFTICSMLIDRHAAKVDWPAVYKSGMEYVSQARSYIEQNAPVNNNVGNAEN